MIRLFCDACGAECDHPDEVLWFLDVNRPGKYSWLCGECSARHERVLKEYDDAVKEAEEAVRRLREKKVEYQENFWKSLIKEEDGV